MLSSVVVRELPPPIHFRILCKAVTDTDAPSIRSPKYLIDRYDTSTSMVTMDAVFLRREPPRRPYESPPQVYVPQPKCYYSPRSGDQSFISSLLRRSLPRRTKLRTTRPHEDMLPILGRYRTSDSSSLSLLILTTTTTTTTTSRLTSTSGL